MFNPMVTVLCGILAYVGMEFMAWFTHKYIMHGIMWHWHQDHHQKDHEGWFERNDIFFVIYAIPGIMLILWGLYGHTPPLFAAGLGITLYGATYFLVHDVFIHQRIKWFRNTNNPYLLALRRAHKAHHKHLGKHHGVSFGMLVVKRTYFKNRT